MRQIRIKVLENSIKRVKKTSWAGKTSAPCCSKNKLFHSFLASRTFPKKWWKKRLFGKQSVKKIATPLNTKLNKLSFCSFYLENLMILRSELQSLRRLLRKKIVIAEKLTVIWFIKSSNFRSKIYKKLNLFNFRSDVTIFSLSFQNSPFL